MDREVLRAIEDKSFQSELSRSYRGANERCPQQGYLNGSRSYRASIEHTETSLMDRVVVK